MGCDYTAYAVLGVKIAAEKTVQTVQRRGCEHAASGKFCATCGKPAWVEERRTLPAFEDLLYPANGAFGAVASTDRDAYFWGFCVSVEGENSSRHHNKGAKLPGNSLAFYLDRCKQFLEPLGLWDEGSFGLWSVMHCSY